MKIEFKKKQPVTIALIVSSILALVFATISFNNASSLVLRIFTQGSLCITMLLNGVKCFVYQKQRALGYLLWIASASLLFVIFDSINLGLKYNLF